MVCMQPSLSVTEKVIIECSTWRHVEICIGIIGKNLWQCQTREKKR